MSRIPIAEAKANFSAVVKKVQDGEECIITKGQGREPVAVLVSFEDWKRSRKRVGGTLKDKMDLVFADDWHMTDEELLNS
jgi:prevent-host-death family protein